MDYMKSLATLSLGSRLKRLSDQLFAEVAIIYDQAGLKLNPNYFPLINLLNSVGPIGITQAADYLSISHPAVSKIADKMIKEGYLIKQPHPTDKRASLLSLTIKALHIIKQATPVWEALKQQLDYIENLQTHSLLTSIDQFESNLNNYNLAQAVANQLTRKNAKIELINWHPDYKNDFYKLNFNWLESEFYGDLTEKDKHALENPESYYLSHGGYIFFAKQEAKIVGCIAMKPEENGYMELSKMAVTPEMQGQGVGRKLILEAIAKARELAVSTIYLETNSKLKRALTLYQHIGFAHCNHPKGKSDYHRADVYMELKLYV
ncbi:GNAT family N-acetyltransferase [Psychromonas sp. psych-6C06]|uniref:bifunctional helix-turn-helix transcriptional regulator/GNAT family N-acetyltransferase n=1 Tax=Psychromonas sp. psych-6C06 TaxID=2058089 RepID=UPI000C32F744|nr:bifunctional helix-turn-helix transcriptional regulator/GNAT family N-acetyltransferase [Psychromonas sp. psych-6C06]PKF60224.1 GNAT family N-acetyltransferase [Psychromonas sp. psych-6C06]